MSLKPFLLSSVSFVLLSSSVLAQTPAAQPATPPAQAALPATTSATIALPATSAQNAPSGVPSAMPAGVAATPAAPLASPGSTPVTHADFQALLKETLNNNPEIIIDAVKHFHEKQRDITNKEVEKTIAKYDDELFKNEALPSVGDAKTADVTIVEFFDYHCGYCKRMLPTITQLHSEDPKLRVVFREFPILSEDSVTAAKAALAVNQIDKSKYFAFHTALMNSSGAFNEKTLTDLAKKQGIDGKKLKKEMENPEIDAMLSKNRQIAEELGVRGTPALIIGKQLLPGAVPYEDLKKIVAAVRSGAPADPSAKPATDHP